MSSQPPEDAELPDVPGEQDEPANPRGAEFVAPLEPSLLEAPTIEPPMAEPSTAETPAAGYDIPATAPVKRYRAKIVWLWLVVSFGLLSLVIPLAIAVLGSMQSSGGFLPVVLLLFPFAALVIAGVGLAQSRNDELPDRRSMWMGLLIGAGLSLSCAGICFSALSGI